MSTPQNNKAIYFIFITMLIDVMGLGIVIPVLPDLVSEMAHVTPEKATVIAGYMAFVYSGMQFFFSPVLGSLSDRFGRRPVLLFSLFGFGVDYLLLGFANSITFLFIGRTIAGITGASFTTANAYIGDISNKENRAKNFGMVGAAFGLGFIAGPAIGGLLGQYGLRVPFFAAASLSLLNFIYGYFFVPESLKPENRRKFEWKRANPLGALSHLKKYPNIIGLVIAVTLVTLGGQVLPTTWSFYGIHRYAWDRKMIGYSLAFVGVMVAIVQGGLTRFLVPKLGEKRSIYIGLTLNAVGLAACGLASASWMAFAAIIPLSLGGLAGPTMQAKMSGEVPANEQGELQGALNSLVSIDSILAPLIFPQLFYFFTSAQAPIQLPGIALFVAAGLSIVSLLVCVRTLRK